MERIFCACAPGLEPYLAAELAELGLAARAVRGGAEAEGDDAVALACLASRLADAVKVRTALGSRDAVGEPLFRRGWRARIGAAPLRETLAAGLLRVAGFTGDGPLVDPMCGSGTIAIEAALLASRRAPGLGVPDAPAPRRFAFESWPGHDRERTAALRARLAAAERPIPAEAQIFASDRNQGALRLAEKNARAAGVAGAIRFARASAEDAPLPPGPGTLAVNPPYGERLEDPKPAWLSLGRLLERGTGYSLAALGPEALARLIGRAPAATIAVQNSGIRCAISLYPRDYPTDP